MGFLGMSGDTWKRIGKVALKVAPIAAAPFTGGLSLLALGAGAGAVSGALDGGGWRGALLGGALGAIPGGGGAGSAAGGITRAGLGQLATGVAKGAATNFATGTATGLATGHGVKDSLRGGAGSAVSGLGTTGTGGFANAAKTIGRNVATNVGGQYASAGLQKAGVPAAIASQGANVFSNYLGRRIPGAPAAPGQAPQTAGTIDFTSPTGSTAGGPAPRGNSLVQSGPAPSLGSYLPQPAASTSGGGWKDALLRAGSGALAGAANGGGWQGAANGAMTGAGGGAPAPGRTSTPGIGTPPYSMSFGTNASGQPTGGGGAPQTGGASQPDWQPTDWQPAAGSSAPADPNAPKPATWAERYGPLIAQGAGLAGGALLGRQAQKNAMERSPEEQAALAGAQGAAGAAQQGGQQALTEGRDYLQKPAHYFETLLGGNRAAMAQAVAAPTAQISANYRGSERALNQAGVRGAARDVAVADLNRQRASQIAGLTTGVQPYAAEQLAGLGQNMMAQAPGLLGTSGNIYGNLLNSGSANRVYARREGADTAAAIGGLARDVGEVAFRRPQAPGTPAATTPKAAGGATTPQTQPQTQTDAPAPPMGSPQQAPASIPYRRRAPVQQDIPNQPPPGYRFGTPTGDYDPNNNRAYT